MSNIELSWHDDNRTILVYTFHAGWDWKEYHETVQEAWQMIERVNRPVCVLMDLTHAKGLPNGAIGQARRALAHPRHDHIQKTVIAGANAFVRRLGDVVQKISNTINWDYDIVATVEEAHEILEMHANA